jgi:hypothetical protein
MAIAGEHTIIQVPKKTVDELKKIKLFPCEPHYHVINRLIVEHKEAKRNA